MPRIQRIEDPDALPALKPLKEGYIQQATAPLDGMWLTGFVPMASHFGFYESDELVGYCCVNDDGYLLQFYCDPNSACDPVEVFASLFQNADQPAGKLAGVFVSTAEPNVLTLCMDRFPRFEVNALMYQRHSSALEEPLDSTPTLLPMEPDQLLAAVEIAVQSIGAPDVWLRGYYASLIQLGELFGAWKDDRLIALGESRGYDDYQIGCADLGVLVSRDERGKGHATQVLLQLARYNEARGLTSICSTERNNIAAQKAIARAGFKPVHRIVQFHA